MPLIAITGGIASGKSTVTRQLSSALGAPAFDTDDCARSLVNNDLDVSRALRDAFGDGIFNDQGKVDRGALRQIVFATEASRRTLEAILHPRVRARWTGWAQEELQKHQDAILLVEIPLLYETRAASLFDQAVVVGCAEELQVRRLTTERRLSSDTARQIIASQWPFTEKIRRGDHLIWNNGSSAGLHLQVDLCARYYRDLYHGPSAAK